MSTVGRGNTTTDTTINTIQLGVKEYADAFGLGISTVRKYIRTHKVQAEKNEHGHWFITNLTFQSQFNRLDARFLDLPTSPSFFGGAIQQRPFRVHHA